MTGASNSRDVRESPEHVLSRIRAYAADLIGVLGMRRLGSGLLLVLGSTVMDSVAMLSLLPLLSLSQGSAATPATRWLQEHGIHLRLDVVLLLFVLLALARAALGRLRELTLMKLQLDYQHDLRRRLESALARASWLALSGLRHAKAQHLMFEQMARVGYGTQQMLTALSGTGLALAGLVVALIVSPLSVALFLVVCLLLMLGLRGRLARVEDMGSALGRVHMRAFATARDFLSGLKLVKAHGAEPRYLKELERRSRERDAESLRFVSHQHTSRGRLEAGGTVLLAVLLYIAATWTRLGLPQMLLLVLAFSRLLPLARQSSSQLQNFTYTLPAFAKITATIATLAEQQEAVASDDIVPLPLLRNLSFEKVRFAYPESSGNALEESTLEIKALTTTLLIGPSGAGKTTFVDIALGLLPASSGEVRVDGASLLDTANLGRWRRSVAYVAQDCLILPASVRENLCWPGTLRPDAALLNALDQADAMQFVTRLPGQLDHVLGERGEGLSGGERQRLALARALLSRPSLLVLDESTSQLDKDSERRIFGTLDRLRGHITVLVIAHRGIAAHHADRVLTIDDGKISDLFSVFGQDDGAQAL